MTITSVRHKQNEAGHVDDNSHLLALQDKYLLSRSDVDLSAMYVQIVSTSMRMIRKMCRKIPGIYSEDEKEERARNAAAYIIQQYMTRPDFKIKTSMSGYIFLRCRKELYYRRKVDEVVIFSSHALESLDKDTRCQ